MTGESAPKASLEVHASLIFRSILAFLFGAGLRPRRRAAMAGAFALTLLLASAAGLRAQNAPTSAQNSDSGREPSPVRSRGISHSGIVPKAGAFEVPADPAAVSADRVATNFGKLRAGQSSGAVSATFTFKRSATLGSIDVVTKGAKDLDFDDAHAGTCEAGTSYSAGSTCTVHVAFRPRYAGVRSGAVILRDGAGQPLAEHPLFGTGLAALISFSPPQVTTPVMSGALGNPVSLAVDGSGNVYIADQGLAPLPAAVYLETLQTNGSFVQTAIGAGWTTPSSVAVDGSGSVYVTDSGTGDVYKETPSGNSYTQSLVASGFTNPDCIAFDGSGNMYVCDYGDGFSNHGAIYQITNIGASESDQQVLTLEGYAPDGPTSAAFDSSGNLYVVDTDPNELPSLPSVFKLTPGSSIVFDPPIPDVYTPSTIYTLPVSSIVQEGPTQEGFVGSLGSLATDPLGDVDVGFTNVLSPGSYDFNGLRGVFFLAVSNSYAESDLVNLPGNLGLPATFAFDQVGDLYYFNGTTLVIDELGEPSALVFPDVTSAETDPQQTVTITDVGNNTLRFAVPASGVNPSISAGYTLDTTSPGVCPSIPSSASGVGTLIPGASCTLPVTFDPTHVGSYPGTLVLTDSNMQGPGLWTATQTIQLSGAEVGPTAAFTISAPATANETLPFSLTITAVDSHGNTTPDYAGTVHFTSSTPNVELPSDTTLTGGTGIFSAVMFAKGAQTITGTDTVTSNITGTSGSISVDQTHFAVSTTPLSVSVGEGFTVTATVENSSGNTLTNYIDWVQITSSDPIAPQPYNSDNPINNGVGTYTMALFTPGPQTVIAQDAYASYINGVSPGMTVKPSQLIISAPGSAPAGQPFNLTVTVEDMNGDTLTGYIGTIHFTSSDPTAQLPADSVLTGGTGTFSATLTTAGSRTITASDSVAHSLTATTGNINVTAQNLVVTTNQDDAGNAANCSVQAAPGTGIDSSCSLRDAVLEAAAMGAAVISFDSKVFKSTNAAAENTITLGSAGALNAGQNTSLIGPTTGTGATLKNLVTISGNNATEILNNSSTAVGLTNLTIANAFGGAVANSGSLTVTNCTFSNNAYPDPTNGYGGAIFNDGTLTVINSTFFGNSATIGGAIATQTGTAVIQGSTFYNNSAGDSTTYGTGGAIVNFNPLTVTNSTFTGNTATGQSGALDNSGPVTLTNTTFSGNTTAAINAVENFASITAANSIIDDIIDPYSVGSYTDNGGNVTTPGVINLAPLGSYGGPTQTMPPLPGSAAICGGTSANATAASLTTDQRGFRLPDPDCPSGTVDSGAVQTSYAIAFTTNPGSTQYLSANLSPAPVVGLTESGMAATAATSNVTLSDSSTALSGTLSEALASGSASFPAVNVPTAQSTDALTAKLSLNPALSPPLNIFSAPSTTFQVIQAPLGVSLTHTNLPFGLINVGDSSNSATVTMTNTGGSAVSISSITVTGANPSSFVFANNCGSSLASGASCIIHGHFAPVGPGAVTAAVTIVDNAPDSPQSINLSGTGVASAQVSLTSTSLTYGSQNGGTSSGSESVTMTNTGDATLSINSIGITGANASSFVFANTCGTSLAPGANCTIHGHFAPQAVGALTAAVTISDNAPNSPQSIALSGTGIGVAKAVLSVTNVNYGSVEVGQSSWSDYLTMTNTGNIPLTITSIGVTGANPSSFVFENTCGSSLAAGANCSIHGHFAPVGPGAVTAAVAIVDNDASSPQSITLSGTGVSAATAILSRSTMAFATETVGQSTEPGNTTLTNTGNETLLISSINLTGANATSFDFANNCGSSLAPGASCTIHGHFKPTATGPLTASITITDNAANSPQAISLTGTGQ